MLVAIEILIHGNFTNQKSGHGFIPARNSRSGQHDIYMYWYILIIIILKKKNLFSYFHCKRKVLGDSISTEPLILFYSQISGGEKEKTHLPSRSSSKVLVKGSGYFPPHLSAKWGGKIRGRVAILDGSTIILVETDVRLFSWTEVSLFLAELPPKGAERLSSRLVAILGRKWEWRYLKRKRKGRHLGAGKGVRFPPPMLLSTFVHHEKFTSSLYFF